MLILSTWFSKMTVTFWLNTVTESAQTGCKCWNTKVPAERACLQYSPLLYLLKALLLKLWPHTNTWVLWLIKIFPLSHILTLSIASIFVNDLGQNLNASVNFYTADTIIYCCAHTVDVVFEKLQLIFWFYTFIVSALVLNAVKNKVVFFSNTKSMLAVLPSLVSAKGISIETVASYKYLYYYQSQYNIICFSCWYRLFLPLLDYDDTIYMSLHILPICVLCFITGH